MGLPTAASERKDVPIYSGVLKYFPDAIAYIAKISKAGNDQHNPGQPLHWSREKSGDHHDCVSRHLLESGTVDSDGLRHSGKLAWRALALLQLELEAAVELEDRTTIYSGLQRCGDKHQGKFYTCSLKTAHTGQHEAYANHDRTEKPVSTWPNE